MLSFFIIAIKEIVIGKILHLYGILTFVLTYILLPHSQVSRVINIISILNTGELKEIQ